MILFLYIEMQYYQHNILNLNNIAIQILNLKEYDKQLGFWEIINKNNLDSIEIFKPNYNPRLFDFITSVYKFFDKSEYFCIKYILNRKCEIFAYFL